MLAQDLQTETVVLISDIHYTVPNISLCSDALLQAIDMASSMDAPLIIAGDLNDSKSIIRGEVANELLRVFKIAEDKHVRVTIIPGNHDLLSAKDVHHGLHFLQSSNVDIISFPTDYKGYYLIPYQPTNAQFLEAIKYLRDGTTVIAHQGFKGANLGHYFKDDSSVDPEHVKHLRVISGHYHMHQTIGTVTYLGSPMTQTFAEANDGHKGFAVLKFDGELILHPTNIRKHIVVERTIETTYDSIENYRNGDILQLKVTGSSIDLDKLDKKAIGMKLIGSVDFRLDKIYTDRKHKVYVNINESQYDLFDEIIDNTQESESCKKQLKTLWRNLV